MSVTINGSTGVTTPGISNSEGYTGDGLTIAAGAPSGAVQVDASGNLGLGVTPSAWGSANKAIQFGRGFVQTDGSGTGSSGYGRNAYQNGSWYYQANGYANMLNIETDGAFKWFTAPSGTAGNAISFTQAMTLDASGNLLVGNTSARSGKILADVGTAASTALESYAANTGAVGWRSTSGLTTGTAIHGYFTYNGSGVGSITSNSTTTSYNTSSDYRLKENIQPMTGALSKVAALKPCTYKWKSTGEADEGFIAHELQEVCPSAVTGDKDAVDAEGKPVYQGIDTSFLVATLTAAIQELKAQVDAQAVEIAALKGQA